MKHYATSHSDAIGNNRKSNIMQDIDQLFEKQLSDLCNAEDYFKKIIPEMMANIEDNEILKFFLHQLDTTRRGRCVLVDITAQLELKQDLEISEALEIRIEEIEVLLSRAVTGEIKSDEILRLAHQIMIYEIAGYITLYTYADELGYGSFTALFQRTLDELYRLADEIKEFLKAHAETEFETKQQEGKDEEVSIISTTQIARKSVNESNQDGIFG